MYFLFMLGLTKNRRLQINMMYIKEYEVIVNWGKLSKLTHSFRFLSEPPFFRVKDATYLWV